MDNIPKYNDRGRSIKSPLKIGITEWRISYKNTYYLMELF